MQEDKNNILLHSMLEAWINNVEVQDKATPQQRLAEVRQFSFQLHQSSWVMEVDHQNPHQNSCKSIFNFFFFFFKFFYSFSPNSHHYYPSIIYIYIYYYFKYYFFPVFYFYLLIWLEFYSWSGKWSTASLMKSYFVFSTTYLLSRY